MLCWLSSHDNGLSMVIHVYPSSMKHAPSHDNGQSMVIYPSSMNNAPSVVIVSCQWTEHVYISLKYE